MSITITENADHTEEEKPVEKEVVEKALEAVKEVDEAEELRKKNDALEIEVRRSQELKAKLAVGGEATAGQEKTPEQEAEQEAANMLKAFEPD